jgi:hypothetical protein
MAGYKTARREGGDGSETRRYGIMITYLHGRIQIYMAGRWRRV